VLDLLVGVGRQIHPLIPRTGSVATWWSTQMRQDRKAIRDLRNAELKRLEHGIKREVTTQTNVPGGMFHGKRINPGDTLAFWRWYFVSGRFEGREVLPLLSMQLADHQVLIREAESRLP
jgi:hypothetical protein